MINIIGGTDTGLVRKINQDRFEYKVLGETLAYAVLCDGMGGPAGGHVASETATRFVADALGRDLRPNMAEPALRNLMQSAAAGANALVYEAAQQSEELAGMGTTIVIAVFEGDHIYIAYAGDSRAYHLADGAETQLTRDHTVVQMLLDIGEITEQDAQTHPKRHYITRAVGVASGVDVDFLEHRFAPGDIVLLCSDGLYNYLDLGALGVPVGESIAAGSVNNLIEIAKAGGGSDNITAVIAWRAPKDGDKEVS